MTQVEGELGGDEVSRPVMEAEDSDEGQESGEGIKRSLKLEDRQDKRKERNEGSSSSSDEEGEHTREVEVESLEDGAEGGEEENEEEGELGAALGMVTSGLKKAKESKKSKKLKKLKKRTSRVQKDGKKVGKMALKRKREEKGKMSWEKRLKNEEDRRQGLRFEVLPGFTVRQVKLDPGELNKTKGPVTVFEVVGRWRWKEDSE